MERTLDHKAMNTLVYVAIAFALWGITTSLFALTAPSTVWTWLLVAGAAALMSLSAFRIGVANELGVHARASSRGAGAAAAALERRLGLVDSGLAALLILWMAPLVLALTTGVVKP